MHAYTHHLLVSLVQVVDAVERVVGRLLVLGQHRAELPRDGVPRVDRARVAAAARQHRTNFPRQADAKANEVNSQRFC